MNNTIAKIVSVCFHPLIVFSLLYIGLLQQTRSYWQIQNNTLYANTLTVTLAIISIGVIFILYKLKLISTITLENRKDRIWGFSCFMIMLILLLFLFPKNLPTHIILIINLLWALETILLITLFWKISAHLFFWGIWNKLPVDGLDERAVSVFHGFTGKVLGKRKAAHAVAEIGNRRLDVLRRLHRHRKKDAPPRVNLRAVGIDLEVDSTAAYLEDGRRYEKKIHFTFSLRVA